MTPDAIPSWLTVAKDLGFPALVAFFVLYRLDRRLEAVQQALTGLTIIIAAQSGVDMDRVEALTGHSHKRKGDDRKTA